MNPTFWILQTLAMLITCALTPGLSVSNPLGAFLAVVALAFVNTHVWDAALFFHIPDTLTFQTAVLLLSNGAVFWAVVKILPWIEISGCLPPLIAPVLFTLISLFLRNSGEYINWKELGSRAGSAIYELKDYLHRESSVSSAPVSSPDGSGDARGHER